MVFHRQIKNLDELMDGALNERFNAEMNRVMENVFDPNTNPRQKRQIVITINVTPNERRDAADLSFDVRSKIAAPLAMSQTVFLTMGDDGTVTATEMTDQIPGQVDMEGGIAPMPTVLEFNKKTEDKKIEEA